MLEQCKLGNQHAQMEVYNRFYKAMYNTCIRIVKNSFIAEDIMQESFLQAFMKLDSLRETSLFGSWLKRIVINNSINHYQNSIKTNTVPLDNMLHKIADDQTTAASLEWNTLKVTQVLEGMDTLKDNYRIILTLFFIEGYDYEEICKIMDISYANCRTMISRAKEQLRKKLNDNQFKKKKR